MKIVAPAYGEITISTLETALFEAVAARLKENGTEATAEEVAIKLVGRYGVPSDSFYAAYDNEVAALAERFSGD